jgi:hypothetical protein
MDRQDSQFSKWLNLDVAVIVLSVIVIAIGIWVATEGLLR